MQEFMRKFTQLNDIEANVVLEHCLFDRQAFCCEILQTINDDERIGIILKGQEKFIYKQHIKTAKMNKDTYTLSDGRLTITINVNKM